MQEKPVRLYYYDGNSCPDANMPKRRTDLFGVIYCNAGKNTFANYFEQISINIFKLRLMTTLVHTVLIAIDKRLCSIVSDYIKTLMALL